MLFHETNQQFLCCRLHMNSFSIYLPDFMNDLFKQFLVFASNSHGKYLLDLFESAQMRDKWNFRVGLDAWRKITLDKYVNEPYQFLKKKTLGMLGTDLYWISDRIGHRAKKIMYLSIAV